MKWALNERCYGVRFVGEKSAIQFDLACLIRQITSWRFPKFSLFSATTDHELNWQVTRVFSLLVWLKSKSTDLSATKLGQQKSRSTIRLFGHIRRLKGIETVQEEWPNSTMWQRFWLTTSGPSTALNLGQSVFGLDFWLLRKQSKQTLI